MLKKKNLSFRFTAKLKVPRFPIYALPSQSLPHYHYAHHSGTFLIKDEPTLTHNNYPMPIVFLGAHSQCCTFNEFFQTCSDKYPSLEHHAEYVP